MTELKIPRLCLVALVGVTGSGKSSFAARHFRPTEVLSSDTFRGLVGDDENDQSVSGAAFAALHAVAAERLKLGRLTVVDATNVLPDARRPLLELAREHHVLPVAIVLDVPPEVCAQRNLARPDRGFGAGVVRRQYAALTRSVGRLEREGFRRVFRLRGVAEVDAARIVTEPAWADKTDLHGPFDIVGDVHGCEGELASLLDLLGYRADAAGIRRHPAGRTAVFLGDLVDRGPDTPGVLRTVMGMVAAGTALCVPGNHEAKLLRALRGRDVRRSHGLAESLDQLAAAPEEFTAAVITFLDGLVSHYVLDSGRLVVAHAGLPEQMHGRASAAVRAFALYGETTGETDEFGLPVRYPWARDYRGRAAVVYGHTPVPEATWVNDTICIDTGCVFGGRLTALRYPERELVSVPAAATYYQPARPLTPPPPEPAAARPEHGSAGPAPWLLDVADVLGRRSITTALRGRVTVPEQNAAAALEVMSRFAADPRWLIYLPPTMPPVPASTRPSLLEHPADALDAYRRAGISQVICEEKHMGSRAVVIVCRTPEAAKDWFGSNRDGIVYTRTGRRFFADSRVEQALLTRVAAALASTGLWPEFGDWVALDCEIMPWSVKAEDLVRGQYAAVGAAAVAGLTAATEVCEQALLCGADVTALRDRSRERLAAARSYTAAYRHYVWPVRSLDDMRLAPFQVLAGSAGTFFSRDHRWHLGVAARLSGADPLIVATRHVLAGLDDEEAVAAVTAWWEQITGAGGEGMVAKPLAPVTRARQGIAQHGMKCRGPDYLRLIYGPEYAIPGNLGRLAGRNLSRKRSLAASEFALGAEALDRFTRREPLFRVHECVFGVLALESEPVDPRL